MAIAIAVAVTPTATDADTDTDADSVADAASDCASVRGSPPADKHFIQRKAGDHGMTRN